MPRNASGTYTLPSGNPVSSGTLIDATWANNTLNDLANEVTDSLSRSGEGGMLAPLRLNDGVQATPGLAFTNEPSTGMYRAGTNEAWLVAGGTQVLQFTTNGAAARFAAGAVGTPSITALGDLNTGLWFPAADTLAASTGGSERLRVNSSGNVGIGTTNPNAPLVVSNAGAGGIEFTPTGGPGGGAYFNSYNRSTLAFIPWTNYASAHTWYTSTAGSTRAMDLDASGNLGIGTASPANRLSINDPGTGLGLTNAASGNFNIGLLAGTGSALAYVFQRANSDLLFGTNNAEVARFTAAGNLGIGTASPSQKLHVVGSTLVPIANSYFTFDVRFGIGTPDSDGLQIFTGDYTRFGNRSAGGVFTEGMRLDSSGRLGIGTASPAQRLDVTGAVNSVQARFGNVAGRGLTIGTALVGGTNDAGVVFDAPITSDGTLIFQTVSTERMRITATGNIVAGASAALATTATNGFLYVPTCAGTPTGVPTAITGMAPIVVNTTNNKLYFYSGGAWRDAGP